MSRFIQAIVLSAALLAGVGVTGCAVTRGHETAGEYVDDATITTRVKTRFAKDPDVSAMRIKVNTDKGVVQLSGTAKSDVERQKAIDLARSVPGVKDVQDSISIESANK
jgi:hyperosmotically inducible periplasmic protein